MGNKFGTLKILMDKNLYILGILEGKINKSFHAICFSLSAFHRPYRFDVPSKKKKRFSCSCEKYFVYPSGNKLNEMESNTSFLVKLR